ncbi:phosphodiesterase [Microbacterium paludicola]|uniref:Phosphodiesterase n=1 Tax=Microbacterium paludicola TaxID=300019 RepID=A0A4Y9FRG6_9MICO|nr:phosphodiesterase [Microbacterium paludicola]MBF0817534.1 phosphodiesterase [Microbacterium paludicola]TFU30838.1 phosphodiesterase [Microbacterium paludicola]
MTLRIAEHPLPDHFLVHISDTHFVMPGERLGGVADASAHLRELLATVADTGIRPEALVFTGDLADAGEAEAYAELRSVVEEAAARMGARIIWVMGNHDDRATMRRTLLDAEPTTEPYDRVEWLGGLRIVVLDSTVPGHAHGELEPSQLEWLRGVLAEPAPEGTLLALHHPPIPCLQDLAVTVELHDQPALAEVLRGSDVRAILGGHFHYNTTATFEGVPVSVASSTCYTQDLLTPGRGTRGRDAAQTVNFVHVYERTVMHSVVPAAGAATVGRFVDAAGTVERLRQEGIVIPASANAGAPEWARTSVPAD